MSEARTALSRWLETASPILLPMLFGVLGWVSKSDVTEADHTRAIADTASERAVMREQRSREIDALIAGQISPLRDDVRELRQQVAQLQRDCHR